MPLVVVTGYPASGKSSIVDHLQRHLQKLEKKVAVVCDSSAIQDFNRDLYNDPRAEKELRSALRSEVERLLSTDTITILDSLNYIKGYRYEIFCLAKARRTTYCVLYCKVDLETALAFNTNRENGKYSVETLKALSERYEEPCAENRWDSPLITYEPLSSNLQQLLDELTQALCHAQELKPNQSVQNQAQVSTNFLTELNHVIDGIISSIWEAQTLSGNCVEVTVPYTDKKVTLIHTVSRPALARTKRQFLNYIKGRPNIDVTTETIAADFVLFINSCSEFAN